jgi:uncharacterized protein YlxW (UPF0749 family)
MTQTTESSQPPASPRTPAQAPGQAGQRSGVLLRAASVLACAALGFLLVTQLRATEDVGERLDIEREEDLAQILADLSTESDRLQEEITSLRLTLLAFENSAEGEELALRSLQSRLAELQVLAGTVAVEGEGVRMTVEDPEAQVTQELLVDAVQELRDAGAEAIAVNDIRLIASSAFTTRNAKVVLDGTPLQTPLTINAIGPSDTIAKALAIPGGAVDSLQSRPQVTASVESLEELTIPARPEPMPYVFGEPVPPDTPD